MLDAIPQAVSSLRSAENPLILSHSTAMSRGKFPIVMYGIKNCDTIKKAREWLRQNAIQYDFHDYKLLGINIEELRCWCSDLGWQAVINRSGTTFRRLQLSERESLDEERAIQLMTLQPSLMRRPIVRCSAGLVVGFKPEKYMALFGTN